MKSCIQQLRNEGTQMILFFMCDDIEDFFDVANHHKEQYEKKSRGDEDLISASSSQGSESASLQSENTDTVDTTNGSTKKFVPNGV